ncbi:MAG: hypothetical protein HQL56_05685 [Magnetococcales bacterium]|nr:hypothetical protein [Magnetococcales bacterium]
MKDPKKELQPYEVVPYTLDAFVKLLAKFGRGDRDFVAGKTSTGYLANYFADLGLKTIIVETSYVDHDYLEDYTGYYARCFTEYPNRCARIHLFSIEFLEDDMYSLLQGSGALPQSKLQESYLGFMVIKPLPKRMIGKTCLKTYGTEGSRYYVRSRSYQANLFGIPLTISNTLAFQEQDSVAAACATSAV